MPSGPTFRTTVRSSRDSRVLLLRWYLQQFVKLNGQGASAKLACGLLAWQPVHGLRPDAQKLALGQMVLAGTVLLLLEMPYTGFGVVQGGRHSGSSEAFKNLCSRVMKRSSFLVVFGSVAHLVFQPLRSAHPCVARRISLKRVLVSTLLALEGV